MATTTIETNTAATQTALSATHNVPTTSTPSPFPPTSRYQIRRLTPADIPVVTAIMAITNLYDSPVWPVAYPHAIPQRCYDCVTAGEYLVRHQIEDGHSFCVFDTEYAYQTVGGREKGGAVLWDETKTEASREELEAGIDSGIVSIALSYDAANPLDMQQMGPLVGLLPLFGAIYHRLVQLDPRDQAGLEVQGRGQVLKRNATATRRAASGAGLTKKMANWLMRYARAEGYGFVGIECLHDKVSHIWENPEEGGMRADVVCAFRTDDYTEVDGEGRIIYPFNGAKQRVTKVYVNLNAS